MFHKRCFFIGLIWIFIGGISFADSENSFHGEWILLSEDSFTEPLDHWNHGNWTFDTNLCEFREEQLRFTPEGVILSLEKKGSHQGEYGDKAYWGAEYYSPSRAQQYGRFSCWMKPQAPPGVIASFFLAYYDFNSEYTALEENCEIDIEFCGRTDQVQFALHYVDEEGVLQHPQAVTVDLPVDASLEFHEWTIQWLPERISFYMDGILLHSFSNEAHLREMEFPMEPHFNLWISQSVEWAGAFQESSLPVEAAYGWVRVEDLQIPLINKYKVD